MTADNRELALVQIMKKDAEHAVSWDRDILRPRAGGKGKPRKPRQLQLNFNPKPGKFPWFAEKVKELYEEGYTYTQIENELDLTRGQVAGVLFRIKNT